MARIKYQDVSLGGKRLAVIEMANEICADYAAQGYDLTLRQLYYQFVSRGLIPNKQTEYDNLGATINVARLAGLMDWDYITDRTRNVRERSHWDEPGDIIESAARSYHRDMWANQSHRLEVWVEKDALAGVLDGVCTRNDVPYFSCRGYTSQSEMWAAARRIERYLDEGKEVTVIHLGDHDPSGIDMTRDVSERLHMFLDGDGYDADMLDIHRIALNIGQVRQYNPPPNPAKISDSRAASYIERHGASSWELDALEPAVIEALIQETIDLHRDATQWQEDAETIESERDVLTGISSRYGEVVAFLNGGAR